MSIHDITPLSRRLSSLVCLCSSNRTFTQSGASTPLLVYLRTRPGGLLLASQPGGREGDDRSGIAYATGAAFSLAPTLRCRLVASFSFSLAAVAVPVLACTHGHRVLFYFFIRYELGFAGTLLCIQSKPMCLKHRCLKHRSRHVPPASTWVYSDAKKVANRNAKGSARGDRERSLSDGGVEPATNWMKQTRARCEMRSRFGCLLVACYRVLRGHARAAPHKKELAQGGSGQQQQRTPTRLRCVQSAAYGPSTPRASPPRQVVRLGSEEEPAAGGAPSCADAGHRCTGGGTSHAGQQHAV